VSLRCSTTYSSCVNREVAEWLKQQLAKKDGTGPSGNKQRQRKLCDIPTAFIGLAGTNHTASVYCTIVFDLTFFNEVTNSDDIFINIEASVIDSCIEVIIGLPDIRNFSNIG